MEPSFSDSLDNVQQRLQRLRALRGKQSKEEPVATISQAPVTRYPGIIPTQTTIDPPDEQIRRYLSTPIQICEINSKYKDLEFITLLPRGRPVTHDFPDDKLKGEIGITMVKLSPQQIIHLGRTVIPMISSGFSRQGAASLFTLAYNTMAPSPAGGGKRGKYTEKLFEDVSELESVADKLYSEFSETVMINTGTHEPLNGGNNEVVEAAVYSYLAATMMRLFTKSADNYVNAWNHILNSFTKFYGDIINFNLPTPNAEAMKILSNWFSIEPPAKQTLYRLLYISNTNNDYCGFKRFLYDIHLVNTGMHLAGFFVDLCQHLNCSSEVLLQALTSNKYRRQMDCLIALTRILTKNDPQNAKGMWKYGRIFDETFMADIQTKSCPDLVYVLGEALRSKVPKAYDDFDKIAQLGFMTDLNKNKCKEVAQRLISAITKYNNSK